MSAPSLYRRHRPRTFSDVVGQEHVVRTLRNAIGEGRVHHAYLFVGSRGTGKTSMAKILAASLNCVNGPTIDPCGVCESCVSIASATSLDVVEMDAASNNSVDDIRDLREKVAFAPVSGRSKVYILDEAHMLSNAAWNAFLKTLEEPPPNTIFVLATTEANKILPTVVDRCHRFDFGRPTVAQIASVLRRVAQAESIVIPDDALALVARSATGSFRDALGTLEQLVAYSGEAIGLDDVLAVLGVADADLTFGAVDAIATGNVRDALLSAAKLAESGRDLGRFFSDLESHCRALMIVQALGEVPAELSITPEQDARLAEQATRVAPSDVVRLLDLLAVGMRALKDGSEPRTQLELALVKAAAPQYDASTKALLARIERLEGGIAPPPRPVIHDPAVPQTAAAQAASPPAAPAPPAPPAPSPPAPQASGLGREAPRTSSAGDGAPHRSSAAVIGDVPSSDTPDGARRAEEVSGGDVGEHREQPPTPAPPASAQPTAPTPPALTLASVTDIWQAVVETAQAEKPLLGAILADARPVDLSGHELLLAWPHSAAFSKKKAEDPACRDAVSRAVREVTGAQVSLAFELREGEDLPGPATSGLSEEEIVARFIAEFGAEELPPELAQTPAVEKEQS